MSLKGLLAVLDRAVLGSGCGRRLPWAVEVALAAAIGFVLGLALGLGLERAAYSALGLAVFDLVIGVGIIWRRDDSPRHDYPPRRPD